MSLALSDGRSTSRGDRSADRPRLLISGFEPFGGESINPTAELLRDISWLQASLPELIVAAVILPVTFAEAYECLQKKVREFGPTDIVALGQAKGRSQITPERVAINIIDAEIADNSGVRPQDQVILTDAPNALWSTLPIRKMVEASAEAGVPSSISSTAGTYLCNYVMYRILEENLMSSRRCGFIHFPYLPAQAMAKDPPAPSMALEQMKRGLLAMLRCLLPDESGRSAGST